MIICIVVSATGSDLISNFDFQLGMDHVTVWAN